MGAKRPLIFDDSCGCRLYQRYIRRCRGSISLLKCVGLLFVLLKQGIPPSCFQTKAVPSLDRFRSSTVFRDISGSRNSNSQHCKANCSDPILVLLAGIAPPYCASPTKENPIADNCPRIWCVRPVNNSISTSTTPWQLVGMRSPVASTRASGLYQSARATRVPLGYQPERTRFQRCESSRGLCPVFVSSYFDNRLGARRIVARRIVPSSTNAVTRLSLTMLEDCHPSSSSSNISTVPWWLQANKAAV
jgi:hypothetical protein